MKKVNLLSVVQSSKTLNEEVCNKYFDFFQIKPKPQEIEAIDSLSNEIMSKAHDLKLLDEFYFGYTIPQIGKEFDLLRFGSLYNVNVELKSEFDHNKILKQLVLNKYYLSFLESETLYYTYVTDNNKLYSLNIRDELVEISIEELCQLLFEQDLAHIEDINRLFDPSNYLVSPFNSTEAFISDQYFLTVQQEEIKRYFDTNRVIDKPFFLSICGKAGTGKTLITYDIAKTYINDEYKVLIIHVGILNEGHIRLKEDYGWDIISIRTFWNTDLSTYSIIIVDEVQRIYPKQLAEILKVVKEKNIDCIFSYDNNQCLRNWEIENNISELIMRECRPRTFTLTKKIRTNKEIATFIKGLFDSSFRFEDMERPNVELNFFTEFEDVKSFLNIRSNEDWKVINYTPSRGQRHTYDYYKIAEADSTHEVIGQEFDKVIVVIDKHFYYDNKNLAVNNYKGIPYYNPVKMLFQQVTRTRKKLCVVIINNQLIMERCLSMLG